MSQIRVMHIDDEPAIREIVELSLALDREIVCVGCDSGEDALSRATEWKPALIVLDIRMPRMDGPAILAALRTNPATTKIPVVVLTASNQGSELERLRRLGVVAIIPKPFDPMTLAPVLRGHLTRIEQANGQPDDDSSALGAGWEGQTGYWSILDEKTAFWVACRQSGHSSARE